MLQRRAIECLSRKGAILVFGQCQATPFQIIATHLQGEEGTDYTALNNQVRARQMEAIRDRLIEPHAAPGAPVFVCGDMCTPRFTEPHRHESPNYTAMLDTFGAKNGPEERITLDDSLAANQLAVDKTGRRNELDYILVRPNGRALRVERTRHVFQRGGWDSPGNRVDLSYRYAVGATITFDAAVAS
jgi:hypothetical protein